MRPAISINSSLGVKSTRRLTKLKRTPRTPAVCIASSLASLTLRFTVATPRALPPEFTSASTIARLSAPWQVAWTTTLRSKPRWSRSAYSCCLDASQGVYLRSGAKGNSAPGPNTWQCASTAPAGTLNRGFEGPAYQSSQPGVFWYSISLVLSGLILWGREPPPATANCYHVLTVFSGSGDARIEREDAPIYLGIAGIGKNAGRHFGPRRR